MPANPFPFIEKRWKNVSLCPCSLGFLLLDPILPPRPQTKIMTIFLELLPYNTFNLNLEKLFTVVSWAVTTGRDMLSLLFELANQGSTYNVLGRHI